MNIQEAGLVLAKIQAYDNRKVAEANIAAWAEALENVELEHALTAVGRYFTRTREWCMPADIIAGARDAAMDARRATARQELAAMYARQEAGEIVDAERAADLRRTIDTRKSLI